MAKKEKLDHSVILKVKDSTFFRLEQDFQVVILNMADDRVYHVTGVAAYFWLLLDGTRTIGQVIELCRKNLKISHRDFPKKADQFVTEIFLNNLTEPVVSKRRVSKKITKPVNPGLFKSDLKSFILREQDRAEFPVVYAKTMSSCAG